MHAAIALCSLSTGMNFALSSPVSTNSASFSTMEVWGVIGKAETTSTLASLAP